MRQKRRALIAAQVHDLARHGTRRAQHRLLAIVAIVLSVSVAGVGALAMHHAHALRIAEAQCSP